MHYVLYKDLYFGLNTKDRLNNHIILIICDHMFFFSLLS